MQAQSADPQTFESAEPMIALSSEVISDIADMPSHEQVEEGTEPIHFQGHYASCMEMLAPADKVAAYLDVHSEWFPRCAHPMTAEPLGNNGYALIIGRFGSFGYEVEPKVGLHLLPQEEGVYRIETIDVPGYEPPGYHVDFRAALQLLETTQEGTGDVLTRVEWELDLDVAIHFPRFIHALPKSLIHGTGDRLLNQIVRQVSRRLTHKVQMDFHQTRNIPFGKLRHP